ncbi:MAG: 50S ribosomal protein L32 [Clostridia bacterium]|nr:50S ribosomal protein L32 [Clostridia bacterium]
MAVPKRKVSKQRGNKRFASNYNAHSANLVECKQCHQLKASHQVCKNCGYYDGVEVIAKGEDK